MRWPLLAQPSRNQVRMSDDLGGEDLPAARVMAIDPVNKPLRHW